MKNTNFSLLEQLGIPSYERKFEDINLNYVFSAEEIERYSIKKMTTLAIISFVLCFIGMAIIYLIQM